MHRLQRCSTITYTEELKLHIDFKTLVVLWCDHIYLYIYFSMYVCMYMCVCVCMYFWNVKFCGKKILWDMFSNFLRYVDILKMTEKYLKRVCWTYNEFIFNKRNDAHTNKTMRLVRVTIVAVESNKYYILQVCVCSVIYPACSVHTPYCNLWHFRRYSICPHYFIKAWFLEKIYWT
jgi:hypothetical protein